MLLRAYLLNTSVSTFFSHWNLNLIRPSGGTREMLTRVQHQPQDFRSLGHGFFSTASNTHLIVGKDLSPKAVLSSQHPQWCGSGLEENSACISSSFCLKEPQCHCIVSGTLWYNPNILPLNTGQQQNDASAECSAHKIGKSEGRSISIIIIKGTSDSTVSVQAY